jgi:hypothetical protein
LTFCFPAKTFSAVVMMMPGRGDLSQLEPRLNQAIIQANELRCVFVCYVKLNVALQLQESKRDSVFYV